MELHPDLTGEKLQKLQRAQIKMTEMFKEFDNICRKYNLKYWCIGGTLIGILRKDKIDKNGNNVGGWIPFDGDIDVSMLESDYEIFRSKAHELPKNMFLQDPLTDQFYKIKNMNKLRDINSYYVDYTPKDCHKGLQIDIFIWKTENDRLVCNFYNMNRYDRLETIFPLKEAEFEGFNVYIPNKYEEYANKKCGGYPIPMLPIELRKPHEGMVEPDVAHPDDILMYPQLYTTITD